ncbi:hypothetical protein FRC10_005988 [Ceratobasidium sp. 414]|nr:hypothetical protein FRC10_005988 [Ceratobasidium sp. 414]
MNSELKSTFSYQPPSGGDISLKSSDGVIFLAHSLLLRLASSVFADMFSTATHNDLVELADDAESVSLMLRFIYPPSFMDDLPITLLEKSLCIAQKYDITGITTSVDRILVSYSSNKDEPIRSDPIHAFCLAAKYGLPKTHKAAREAMKPGGFEFRDSKQIKALVEAFPSASNVIEILGTHCVRTQSLLDLLVGTSAATLLPCTEDNTREWQVMMCEDCFDESGYSFGVGGKYEPLWFSRWSVEALYNIATRPFKECDYLFQVTILDTIAPGPNVCQACISATRDADDGSGFKLWARGVRRKVEEILNEAEHLYNL